MSQPTDLPDSMLHRATVLCVDDSPDMLFICRRFLEARGYEVLTAPNAETALKTLKENTIDVTVTDYEMPGMTGLELAEEIKHIKTNLPVLMFCSVRPRLSSSVDRYLEKSTGPSGLVAAVQSMVPTCSISKH